MKVSNPATSTNPPERRETVRTTVSVADHENFLAGLLSQKDRDQLDEIDRELDEQIVCDPYAGDPPSRRKDKEIGQLLGLLDNLERGNA